MTEMRKPEINSAPFIKYILILMHDGRLNDVNTVVVTNLNRLSVIRVRDDDNPVEMLKIFWQRVLEKIPIVLTDNDGLDLNQ